MDMRPYTQQRTSLQDKRPTAGKATRMPKAQALSFAKKLKTWSMVTSFVTFGALGSFIFTQHQLQASTTAKATTPSSSTQTTKSSSTSSSSQSSNGFFQNQQGNYGFGSSATSSSTPTATPTTTSSSSSSSSPVTGTHTS